MSESYSPSGLVGTAWTRFTSAEAATGTFGTMDRNNITNVADRTRYLDDATGLFNFPATQVASAGANVLDDYEEGTWSPSDASGAGLSFSSTAVYEKIGRLVIARFSLAYPVTADGSTAIIGGLPFSVPNSGAARQGFVSLTTETTLARLAPNVTATTFNPATTAGANITNATMSGDTVIGTLIYYV